MAMLHSTTARIRKHTAQKTRPARSANRKNNNDVHVQRRRFVNKETWRRTTTIPLNAAAAANFLTHLTCAWPVSKGQSPPSYTVTINFTFPWKGKIRRVSAIADRKRNKPLSSLQSRTTSQQVRLESAEFPFHCSFGPSRLSGQEEHIQH